MEYRQLGRSGLRVSVLTLGTMTFGGRGVFAKTGATDAAGARRLIDIAIDAGINLFDTANIYSWGVSEEILGEALRGRRDSVLVTTKARMKMGDGPNDAGLSRHHLIRECEASLKRLGTDWIDLYQLHEWDGATPLDETLEALDTLVRAGKVRYVGASNYSGWHLMKALAISGARGWQRFVSQQIHYTLEAREAEYELVPIAVDQGLGIMVWSPLAGGLLTGKYRRDQPQPPGTRQFNDWGEPPIRDKGRLFDIVETLVEIGIARNVPPAQVAMAWLLGRPGVCTLVIGARNEEQLQANLGAAELHLDDADRARLDKVSAPPLLYPYWHQARTASDRLSDADLALLGGRL
jgi:aryl-alcohol dehydrogenase-like predicted oxidoreductase